MGPGCTAAVQAIRSELLLQAGDGKKQSSPLCTSWGHCAVLKTGCVCQDGEISSTAALRIQSQPKAGMQTQGQEPLRTEAEEAGAILQHPMAATGMGGMAGGPGTCPVFGSAAGLLLLLVGRGAASGWVECTPHAVGLLAYHHGKALCQLLSGNTVIWSSLILLVPCEWGLANRSFPRSASLRETSCLPRAWVCSLFSAVPMPKCLVVSRRLEMFVLFLEVSLHWNIAVSSTAVNCTLWQK